MEWIVVPFLVVAALAVLALWLGRRRHVDPADMRDVGRAHTSAEAKKYDWGGGGF